MMRFSFARPRVVPWLAAIVILWGAAAAEGPPPPGKTDKCPVCGMFVHKYPDWTAQVIFADGKVFFFDGAKDMFKFYFRLEKYAPGRTAGDIAAVWVTEYYDLEPVDARAAFFVAGSDVLGPMGRELVPFRSAADAEQFRRDHGGSGPLGFGQVTPAVLQRLD